MGALISQSSLNLQGGLKKSKSLRQKENRILNSSLVKFHVDRGIWLHNSRYSGTFQTKKPCCGKISDSLFKIPIKLLFYFNASVAIIGVGKKSYKQQNGQDAVAVQKKSLPVDATTCH